MKKLFFALMAVAFLFSMNSCSKYELGGMSINKKGTLAGEWELDDVEWIDDSYEQFEMSDVDKGTLEITKDGDWNFTIEWDIEGADDWEEEGTWVFEDDKTEIEITYDDGGKDVFDILELTNKQIQLEDGGGSVWVYVKAE